MERAYYLKLFSKKINKINLYLQQPFILMQNSNEIIDVYITYYRYFYKHTMHINSFNPHNSRSQ